MQSTVTSVSAKELREGMEIQEITSLSVDFSCLDKGLVQLLQASFPGAVAMLEKGSGKAKVPIDTINPGDNMVSIHDIAGVSGLNPLKQESVDTLSRLGLVKISIRPFQSEATGQAPPSAPGVIHTNQNSAENKVAEAQRFVEQVETGAAQREKAAASIGEMFEFARTGKSFTNLTADAVEEIVMMDLSTAMAAVTGLKSSGHTYAHCVDMAVILEHITMNVIQNTGGEVSDSLSRSTLAAGFMHDIGKSTVPLDILDSTDWYPPDGSEVELVRSHPEQGAKILSDAGLNETMINVAHYHHVMPDGSLPNSYPEVEFSKVKPMTRLAGVVDAYHSIISTDYGKKMVPGKAVEHLRKQVGKGFDVASLNKFLNIIGKFPIGTLVRLSTGDLAFVIRLNPEDTNRPIVVVAENAQGEILSHNPIIDLIEHKDISIGEVLDHNAHYNASENQALEIFSALGVD